MRNPTPRRVGFLFVGERSHRLSLMVEPNNPRALQELTYIARLRAGGPMAPSGITTSTPPPPSSRRYQGSAKT
jgi:hypothetical protein